jgi:hypothetical protein
MKCSLCGLEFKEEEGLSACRGCRLARSCGLVRCPRCGYQVPLEPKFLKAFKKWRKRINETKR